MMKIINLSKMIFTTKNLLFFTYLLSASCNFSKLSMELLSIDEGIKVDDLISNGFQLAKGVDIPMYFNKNNDTTVVYTFDFDQETLLSKSWSIQFDDLSISDINDLFSYYYLINRGSNIENAIENETYIVYHPYNNQYYDWKYNYTNNYVLITYNYRILDE